SEEDWKNANEKSMGGKDLRLADGGNYIGGIDRVWWLVVTGPPSNKFHYHFAMLPAGNGTELKGTYEVKEGLAWFRGTIWKGPAQNGEMDTTGAGTPIRFALNYRHLGGKVYFNLLCKDAKGNYQYEHRWFRPDAKEWIPVERRTMTFTPQEVTDTQARFM